MLGPSTPLRAAHRTPRRGTAAWRLDFGIAAVIALVLLVGTPRRAAPALDPTGVWREEPPGHGQLELRPDATGSLDGEALRWAVDPRSAMRGLPWPQLRLAFPDGRTLRLRRAGSGWASVEPTTRYFAR